MVITVAALTPLIAIAVSTPSIEWFWTPIIYLSMFAVPMALGLIAAGILRLCHPILYGWRWGCTLVAMCIAVSIVVCCAGDAVIGALMVNEAIRFDSMVPAYVILLIVNVLVQAAGANLLVGRRRRRNLSSA